ncbi:unnamed protein product [Durusdinium trenchii]|uniref:Uncharacterized protein n=2 Tax=Durusdinium trenchii TaxID=1381693 RepID=A0ABP0JT15_9DINO
MIIFSILCTLKRFFFSLWNSIMAFTFLGPALVTAFHEPTGWNLTKVGLALIFPHVAVGLIMPTVLGGIGLGLLTLWPHVFACYRINRKRAAKPRPPPEPDPGGVDHDSLRIAGGHGHGDTPTPAGPIVVEATVVGVETTEVSHQTNEISNEPVPAAEVHVVAVAEKKELF